MGETVRRVKQAGFANSPDENVPTATGRVVDQGLEDTVNSARKSRFFASTAHVRKHGHTPAQPKDTPELPGALGLLTGRQRRLDASVRCQKSVLGELVPREVDSLVAMRTQVPRNGYISPGGSPEAKGALARIDSGRSLAPHPFWILGIGLLLFVSLIVAPRRGAAWFSDDGFFLMRSWMAAHGFGLDRTMIPQDPCYLFNALLMKLGVSGLLAFRQASLLVTFASASAFFLALDPRRLRSPTVPLAVCACLLVSLTSVSTPSSLSTAFFMFGAAAVFLCMDRKHSNRPILSALAGLALAVAGFMHAAVALAMVGAVVLAALVQPALRRGSFLPCFTVVSLLLWGWYLHAIGIGVMIAPPAAHDNSLTHLLGRMARLIYYLAEALAVFVLLSALLRRFGQRRHAISQATLSLLVTAFYGWTLISYVCGWAEPTPWLREPWFRFLFTAQGQSIPRIPGAAAYLFLFAIFRWVAESWTLGREQAPANSGLRTRLVLAIQASLARRKLVVAGGGILLVNWALSVGSLSAVTQNFAFTGGILIGLVLMIDDLLLTTTTTRLPWPMRTAPYLWLGLLLVFTVGFNHPSGVSLFAPGRASVQSGPLKGILVSSEFREATRQLESVYRASRAEGLPLVALDYVPLVNLLLGEPLPSYGIVRPAFHFPEDRVRTALDPIRGWCVLDITGFETRTSIRERGFDVRSSLRRWILANSEATVRIPAPSEDFGEVTIYLKRPAVKM